MITLYGLLLFFMTMGFASIGFTLIIPIVAASLWFFGITLTAQGMLILFFAGLFLVGITK